MRGISSYSLSGAKAGLELSHSGFKQLAMDMSVTRLENLCTRGESDSKCHGTDENVRHSISYCPFDDVLP